MIALRNTRRERTEASRMSTQDAISQVRSVMFAVAVVQDRIAKAQGITLSPISREGDKADDVRKPRPA